MSRLYAPTHRALQDEFDTRKLADGIEQAVVQTEIGPQAEAFISTRDMFFLSTIDPNGRPTTSYKGGASGFVKVVNPTTLVFPSYDGNGMFLSMGNLDANPEVGLLFIDFESPNRLRLQGRASLQRQHPLTAAYPGAELLVQVDLHELWVNCPRYIHRYQKLEQSEYVPSATGDAPIAQWKRIDTMQPLLSHKDQKLAAASGLISADEYTKNLAPQSS